MVTRGIIEEIIDSYTVRVRIPTVDRVATSTVHTAAKDLRQAVVAVMPGIRPHLTRGDVVIIDIPDHSSSSATILGYLYREETQDFKCDAMFDRLNVRSIAELPDNTSVGKVRPSEIECLRGATSNLQKQLDDLLERVKKLETY